ncbi:hypothetical protein JTE90_002691 [Oedothorax gibbosus]|uniref:Uncharacterized protein n=1 Tax=Oedothorax gibbosus TaxID=931172 RepID=A0AAV6TGT4_9ARAC|nr:hypothetical protein JTE90_002691 [Oedothorax gibbosus]
MYFAHCLGPSNETSVRTCVSPRTEQDYYATTSSGQQRRTGHRKRRCAFTRTASLSPDEPIPGNTNSYKEKITLPGSSVDVSEFGCVTALGPEGPISVSGLGNINPIPFRSQRDKHEHVFAFRQTSRFGTDFSDPLGPTDPCFNCCSHGTLLQLQSSRLSLEYLLLPPRSAPVAAPGGLTPGTFNARHRDPPTHCGVNLHEGSSAVAARYRPNAGASSIFRASCFGR